MIRFTEMRGAFCAALLAGSMLATPAAAQSLDDAVGAALARSPAIEAARARADAGAAQVDAARAERAPQAVIEGQVGVGRLNPEGYFGLTADNVTPRQARATVELPIFTGGRVSAAVAAAQGGADAAQLNLRMTALELRVRVVAAYSDAVAGTAMIRRYEQLVTALEEMVRGANLRFQTGGATSTEVAQAQARLAEAQAGLAAARSPDVGDSAGSAGKDRDGSALSPVPVTGAGRHVRIRASSASASAAARSPVRTSGSGNRSASSIKCCCT